MEPERKIEKWLRACAKKRRDAAGEPLKMHPATRRILQNEVARIERPEEKPSLSLWQLVRQEWAWLAGFALIIFFSATLFLPALSSAKHKAQNANALNNLKQIDLALQISAGNHGGRLPASLDELTNELAGNEILKDSRDGKPFAYLAGGETLDDLQTNSVLAYSPDDHEARAVLFADGRVKMDTPEEFSNEIKNPPQLAMKTREIQNAEVPQVTTVSTLSSGLSEPMAVPPPVVEKPVSAERSQLVSSISGPETNTRGAHTFGGFGGFAGGGGGGYAGNSQAAFSPPAGLPAGAAANQALPLQATYYRNVAQQNVPTAGSKTVLKMQNFVAQTQAAVLANFQIQQNGNAIRVIDGDGSIYIGFLLPANAPAQNTTVQTGALALPQSTDQANGQSTAGILSFRVTGLNRTAQQNVIFEGNLAVFAVNGIAASTWQPRQQTAQQQSLQPNYRITGTATLGETNQININAVPVTQ